MSSSSKRHASRSACSISGVVIDGLDAFPLLLNRLLWIESSEL
jgi:hypothetical protein